MVADLLNRTQVENFLRNASADELLEQRSRLQSILASDTPATAASQIEWLVARIAYELRFRVPQAV